MEQQIATPQRHGGDPVTGPWDFRAMWPVEDSDVGSQEVLDAAAADLPDVLARHGALLLGEPTWTIEEVPDPRRWPHTDFAVVAVAPALPATPSREQWPVIIDRLGADGWTDRRIAMLFGIPTSLIETLHRGAAGGLRPAASVAA